MCHIHACVDEWAKAAKRPVARVPIEARVNCQARCTLPARIFLSCMCHIRSPAGQGTRHLAFPTPTLGASLSRYISPSVYLSLCLCLCCSSLFALSFSYSLSSGRRRRSGRQQGCPSRRASRLRRAEHYHLTHF